MATTKTTAKTPTKRNTAKSARKSKSAAAPKRKPSKHAQSRERETTSKAVVRPAPRFEHDSRLPPSLPRGQAASSVTVKDEAEALFYFARIDERLADAWRRDVVMHDGPITIHRVIGAFFDSTHYAYVDRRLIWYLRHDPSDPLGARWEGYLKTAGDAPRGALVRFVGRDILAQKSPPQITHGDA